MSLTNFRFDRLLAILNLQVAIEMHCTHSTVPILLLCILIPLQMRMAHWLDSDPMYTRICSFKVRIFLCDLFSRFKKSVSYSNCVHREQDHELSTSMNFRRKITGGELLIRADLCCNRHHPEFDLKRKKSSNTLNSKCSGFNSSFREISE